MTNAFSFGVSGVSLPPFPDLADDGILAVRGSWEKRPCRVKRIINNDNMPNLQLMMSYFLFLNLAKASNKDDLFFPFELFSFVLIKYWTTMKLKTVYKLEKNASEVWIVSPDLHYDTENDTFKHQCQLPTKKEVSK